MTPQYIFPIKTQNRVYHDHYYFSLRYIIKFEKVKLEVVKEIEKDLKMGCFIIFMVVQNFVLYCNEIIFF